MAYDKADQVIQNTPMKGHNFIFDSVYKLHCKWYKKILSVAGYI